MARVAIGERVGEVDIDEARKGAAAV